MSAYQVNIADQAPDEFWNIIEAASQDPEKFRGLLGQLDREQLIEFLWTYEELAAHLRTDRHTEYAAPTLSEDGMAELANWVVAQGKERYREILMHPELIPPRADDAGFTSELVEEFESRYAEDVPFNSHYWDPLWRDHGKSSPWE